MTYYVPTDLATQAFWGTSPLDISKHDVLYAALIVAAFNTTPSVKSLIDPPPGGVTLIIKQEYIAQWVQENPHAVGNILSKLFRDELFKTVIAQYSLGFQFKEGILQFCKLNKIEVDVHVTYEALERQFRRTFKKKYQNSEDFFYHMRKKNVLTMCKKISGRRNASKYYSDEQLTDMVLSYYHANEPLFYTKQGTKRKKLYRQLRLYVYYVIGKRNCKYMQESFNVPRRSLHYSIRSFQSFLMVAPPIVG